MLYKSLFTSEQKKLAVLIDPDKQDDQYISSVSKLIQRAEADMILVGGSLISGNIDNAVALIKDNTDLPVLLFPGSHMQISNKADGILLLSLISGRNPDLLIGSHVVAAPLLKKSNLEIISTGYILIDGENVTSVEYMSNTKPIPQDKIDIINATALAGEMIGHQVIYLEAGSGARKSVSTEIVKEVKKNIHIPLMVGGGISDTKKAEDLCSAGADIIVIGNAFENKSDKIKKFSDVIHNIK